MSDKAVKERPILFSGPLVRALLAGRKTQTRRPAVRRPIDFVGGQGDREDPSCWGYWVDDMYGRWAVLARGLDERHQNGLVSLPCPYGVPGDRLWVKESHWVVERAGQGSGVPFLLYDEEWHGNEPLDSAPLRAWISASTPRFGRRASIHMPRWASRLTLEITDVRVQRLQEITEEDAKAEGVERDTEPCDHIRQSCEDIGCLGPTFKASFCDKWREIYGDASWDASPWVWALTFKVVKA